MAAGSVDAVVTDPPYGTTACKWDMVIPLAPMWAELKRIIRPKGAVVLFATQPFTSALIMGNVKWFKYAWTWDKITARGHLVAKIRPMQQTEDICVFGDGSIVYNPQMIRRGKPEKATEGKRTQIMGGSSIAHTSIRTEYYPKTILRFSTVGTSKALHPTQKPVDLMEYLIRTYTNKSETVLDFTMGSGTTGVACVQTGRNFIGCEIDPNYFEIAQRRIAEAQAQPTLFEAAD